MTPHDASTFLAGGIAGAFIILPIVAGCLAAQFRKTTMPIADAATAIEGAATSLTTAAASLTTAAGAVASAITNAGDTSALTQPLADLATAVTAVQTAASAVAAAVPA